MRIRNRSSLVLTAMALAATATFPAGCRRARPPRSPSATAAAPSPAPPAQAIGPFYVGVSSLDVEANERAERIFDELSKSVPDEPAVWANLGLARLKLGDVPGAAAALDAAAKAAPGNDAITLLQATVDEDDGQYARAIARLRTLPNPDGAVLYRLADLLGRTGQPADLAQQLEIYDRLLAQQPRNPVVAFSRARLLARLKKQPQLVAAIDALDALRSGWSAAAVHQLEAAKAAAAAGNDRGAAAALTFLQNLTVANAAYQEALAALGATGNAVGQPIRHFLKYRQPLTAVAPVDAGLTFQLSPAGAATPELVTALELNAGPGARVVSISHGRLHLADNVAVAVPAPSGRLGKNALCAFDLNGDYRLDLALADRSGLAVWTQDESGRFNAYQPKDDARAAFTQPAHGVWAVDYDADGDLDLLLARDGAAPQLLRNNGDGTFTPVDALAALPEAKAVAWADFDGDGVDDLAVLDRTGRVVVAWNDRAGSFAAPVQVAGGAAVAIACSDLAGTGVIGLIVLDRSGTVRSYTADREHRAWSSREVAPGSRALDEDATLEIADLDNNGAPDLVISDQDTATVWLNKGGGSLVALANRVDMAVSSLADVDGDGLVDLVGMANGAAVVARTKGTKGYHWQSIQTRALASHADSRINSFGIGGRIEIRAGPLLAVAPIVSPHTHFGLGTQTEVGVARIVWPNGVAQVEFSPAPDQEVTAVQRLKGSCPWVFTRSGEGFQFVKDFIWRSPLGMRINSQDTAGVDQTEDWVLIPGHFLTPENGAYEVRVTAELWETHFFDHVALRAVDHPANVAAFVDERFVPTAPPQLATLATTPPQPLIGLRDDAGRDVSATLAAVDGDYVDTFALGRYQGVAADHWVEFELPAEVRADEPVVLIGTGWIYPTDSSLNVAISQGHLTAPHDLVLEGYDAAHGWRAVSGDLGFPAGKNKTVVIPFPRGALTAGCRRFRLRTNLEIYWDRLAWATALSPDTLHVTPLETRTADLRYRGFSELPPPRRRKPDVPTYGRLAAVGARWQDLEGFYTRFGDVRELLEQTDDRYVIMNAGDELVFRFAALPPPPAGWTRDFVLVGDGWVKDGDFNTANSRTVLPLPSHAVHHYGASAPSLESDPVYQQHPGDWQRFHTRYVSPAPFERGLMRGIAQADAKGVSP